MDWTKAVCLQRHRLSNHRKRPPRAPTRAHEASRHREPLSTTRRCKAEVRRRLRRPGRWQPFTIQPRARTARHRERPTHRSSSAPSEPQGPTKGPTLKLPVAPLAPCAVRSVEKVCCSRDVGDALVRTAFALLDALEGSLSSEQPRPRAAFPGFSGSRLFAFPDSQRATHDFAPAAFHGFSGGRPVLAHGVFQGLSRPVDATALVLFPAVPRRS